MSNKNLTKWQDRYERDLRAYQRELDKMRQREAQYDGDRTIIVPGDPKKWMGPKETTYVRNITAENIEGIIDSSLAMPKVTPVRKKDEELARIIENFLRNEYDRLPTESINDEAERTAKKQGGVLLLPEWDEGIKTHTTTGANSLRVLHPTRFIPQDGVEKIEDMDWFFTRQPMTKAAVKRRWGVDVSDESEEAPEIRDGETAEDLVTVITAHFKNEDGGIGRITWVRDTVVEELEDAQARVQKRCKKCGQTLVDAEFTLSEPTMDGSFPEGAARRKTRKDECSYCGSRSFETSYEHSRKMTLQDLMAKGVRKDVIERLAGDMSLGAMGIAPEALEVDVPYYSPRMYSVVLMQNVTAWNKFLGESDCDRIRDQQNLTNIMAQKIIDRSTKAGTKIIKPAEAVLRVDQNDQDVLSVPQLTDLAMIKNVNFDGDISQPMALMEQAYSHGQQGMGITESFLGRRDATATSGKAKEFSAAQTAGRLESRRVLKKQAWASVAEILFKNQLAYAEERRPVRYKDEEGGTQYEEWNSWAFLDIDDAGELFWNDEFLFSCDDASGLAANREAMWQEQTAHLQSGAFGNPQDVNTLLLYWTTMESLHYPNAGNVKKLLEAQKQAQEQQQALAIQMMQNQQMQQPAQPQMPQM